MLYKLALRIVLSFSLAFTSMANATIITQDIVSDAHGVLGSISINIDNAEEFFIDDFFVNDFVEFKLFGRSMLDLDSVDLASDFFEAHFNPEDLFTGLKSLDFDLDDVVSDFSWQGSIAGGFNDGFLDVFDGPNNVLLFLDDISLGIASVVPEPSALILLFTGLIAFAVRRKVK
jgi:hypothetical protein